MDNSEIEKRKKYYKQGPQLSLATNQNVSIEKKILGNKQRVRELLNSKRRKSFREFDESFDDEEEEEEDGLELQKQVNEILEKIYVNTENHQKTAENAQIETQLDELFTSIQNYLSSGKNTKFQVVCDKITQNNVMIEVFQYLLFHSKKNKLKNKVSWAIANMSSSTSHQQSEVLINHYLSDMITILLDKLTSTKLKEASLWFLANIAACCAECRSKLIYYTTNQFIQTISKFNNLFSTFDLRTEEFKQLKDEHLILSLLTKYLSPNQPFSSLPHPINLTAGWAMCNIARGPPRITPNLIQIFFDCRIDQPIFELLSSLPSFLSPLYSSLQSLNTNNNNININNNNNNNNINNNNNNNGDEIEKKRRKIEDEIKFRCEVVGEGCWLSSYIVSSSVRDISMLLHVHPDYLLINDFNCPPEHIKEKLSREGEGIIAGCIELLKVGVEFDPIISLSSLRLLGNFICKSDFLSDILLRSIPQFLSLLHSLINQTQRGVVQKESAYLLSNLTSGPLLHRQIILSNLPLLHSIAHVFDHSDFAVKKEISFVVVNLAVVPDTSADFLHHFLPLLLPILSTSDLELLRLILHFVSIYLHRFPGAIEKIEELDGLERIENLQYHSNPDIENLSRHIIDTYLVD